MPNSKEEISQQLQTSVDQGNQLFKKLVEKKDSFASEYQDWYTRTLPLVRALAPDRLPEFRAYYEVDTKRKAINAITFTLQDYVNGLSPAPD